MDDPNTAGRTRFADPLPLTLAFAVLLIHLLTSNGYGYFRDELYAIACSKHLAWGYVDQPPFSEFILAIVGKVLGYSQFAIRLLPALCGAAITVLIGRIAIELGGSRFATVLAATSYMVGGVYLAIAAYYSMNCFDHLFWAIAIFFWSAFSKGQTRAFGCFLASSRAWAWRTNTPWGSSAWDSLPAWHSRPHGSTSLTNGCGWAEGWRQSSLCPTCFGKFTTTSPRPSSFAMPLSKRTFP